jgi:hypothetical protein
MNRYHPVVSNEARLAHLKAWEKQFEQEEMWKKKYDWRCPSCGGQMYNCGEITKSEFVLECFICLKRFIAGDYEIKEASETDPEYRQFLQDGVDLHKYLGFTDITTQIVTKQNIVLPDKLDTSYVWLKDAVQGVTRFEISWCVLKQLNNRTGNIPWSNPAAYNAVTRKAFDAIELNKDYLINAYVQKPFTWWQRNISKPHLMRPYISSIKGLILEENRVGKDRRPKTNGEL